MVPRGEDPAVVTPAGGTRRSASSSRRVLFLSSPGVVSQYCVSCGVGVGESEKDKSRVCQEALPVPFASTLLRPKMRLEALGSEML